MAGRIEGDRERVERAGADVAVNDPYRGERGEPGIALVVLRLGLVNAPWPLTFLGCNFGIGNR